MQKPSTIHASPAALILACTLGLSFGANAQIAPECEGVQVPADYDEAKQTSHMANYFGLAFHMTPLAPIVPYEGSKAGVGLELSYMPPLSCTERLALGASKTEDTNLTPISPRPRIVAQLPDLGPVASYIGVTFMPPIPIPLLDVSVMQLGTEAAVAWRSDFGFSLGLRGHMSLGKIRAEIAKPLAGGTEAYDDVGFGWVMGSDVGAAYRFPMESMRWLTLYGNAGIGDVSTLVIIGDDLVVVQNTEYPWYGATAALGAQTLFWDDHLEATLEASSAWPVMNTVKAKIGLVW